MLPSGENAAELYHRVLATDPDNAIAAQGLIEITSQVAATAEALLSANQLSEVDVLVSQAQAAGLVQEGVAEIRRRLDAEHERQNTIFDNLLMAQQLMAQGYLTLPVGQNAVAKLREVQQVDPGNADAIELLKQCAQKLANVAVEAHEQELTDEAKEYLDLALAITPDVESWIALREGWGAIE
jgi:tetratricopeptide (TPR) repeat protein